jgi:hypothetical protein
MPYAAIIMLVVGSMIATVNFWLSFIRPLSRRISNSSVKSVSGIPLFGSLLLWAAAWMFYPSSDLTCWALSISLIDTGGPHWFLGTLLYHSYIQKRTHDEA